LADVAGTEPTKPSEPGSVGFEGSPLGESSKIEAEPSGETANSADAERSAPKVPKTLLPKPLADVDAEERGTPWAQWKADQLNAIFAEHGTGGAGQIMPATVRDGLEKEANRSPPRHEDYLNGMEPYPD
jgi:hypothetical protein